MKISKIDDELEEALRLSREMAEKEAAMRKATPSGPQSARTAASGPSSSREPRSKRSAKSKSPRQQEGSEPVVSSRSMDAHAPLIPKRSVPNPRYQASSSTQHPGDAAGSSRSQQVRQTKPVAIRQKAPSSGIQQKPVSHENTAPLPKPGLSGLSSRSSAKPSQGTRSSATSGKAVAPMLPSSSIREAPPAQRTVSGGVVTAAAAASSSSRGPSSYRGGGGGGGGGGIMHKMMDVDETGAGDVRKRSKCDAGEKKAPNPPNNVCGVTRQNNVSSVSVSNAAPTIDREEKWLRQMEEQQRKAALEAQRRRKEEEEKEIRLKEEEEARKKSVQKQQQQQHGQAAAVSANKAASVAGREMDERVPMEVCPTPGVDEEAEKHANVLRCLQNLKKLPPADLQAALKTLHAYISNLAKNPMDTKFHRINMENKNFSSTVARHQDAITLLKLCGFQQEGSFLLMDEGFMKSKGPFLWNILAKVDFLRE